MNAARDAQKKETIEKSLEFNDFKDDTKFCTESFHLKFINTEDSSVKPREQLLKLISTVDLPLKRQTAILISEYMEFTF